MMMGAPEKDWPQYLMEAFGLGIFMLAICLISAWMEVPASWLHIALPNPLFRRMLEGMAMGLIAISLMYSPWGQSSGAHYNPAVTLTFVRLRRIPLTDAFFYVVFQSVGGILGVLLSALWLKSWVTQAPVHYAVTLPSLAGQVPAFAAEFSMSTVLMLAVLYCSHNPRFYHFTPLVVGFLIAAFVTIETPLSGMSINPARSLASALPAGIWDSFWIYLVAPPLGMLLAAEIYLRRVGISN